jgi:hypothetical protein
MGWTRVLGLAGLIALAAAVSLAEAPKTSVRPEPRPVVAAPLPVAASLNTDSSFAPQSPDVRPRQRPGITAPTLVLATSNLRPRARPPSLRPVPEAVVQAAMVQVPVTVPVPKKGIFGFLRPGKRPEGLAERKLASASGIRILPGKNAVVSKKGAVCGIPDIRGETLAPITGKLKGCGIENPVRVTSVAGVRLSTPATVNCDTAKALRTWIEQAVEPVYGRGQVVELKIAASYACRGRNNKKGAKVSEHGRGNAIDISGLVFANGKSASVLNDFNRPMRRVHKAACGIFATTLGPGSDGHHENHMHFDVARHRSGSYCR